MQFSIVTPSYKQFAYLKLCVASVADQHHVDKEHIIQDAGTGAELENWARSQTGVALYVEKDAGMYDAVNRGLRRANGEICAYLNCDEQYLPGTLATVHEFFHTNPKIDVLFGDVILVNTHGCPISYRRTVLPTLAHVRLAHLNAATCATFFRRRFLEQGFYFDPQWKSIGDAVWIEALLKAKIPMATLPTPLAVFTQTGQNLGANELSRGETRRWRRLNHYSKARAFVTVGAHRLRKALAGAYRSRQVEVCVFTLDSPAKRHRSVSRLGFRWTSN